MAKTRRVGRSLINVASEFATEEQCLGYLEKMRWPEGVQCLACESKRISKFQTKESTRKRFSKKLGKHVEVRVPSRHLYQCLECGRQFSATLGTLFHDSHLPLRKWFLAIALLCNAKKSISALQLQRDLEVSYRTAWYLAHRIRKAMEEEDGPQLTGIVESDETFIGGRYDKRRKRSPWKKPTVHALIKRGGKIEARHVPGATKEVLVAVVKDRVSPESQLLATDESVVYRTLGETYAHETVNHSIKEWARGRVHTNSLEGAFSLFKRAVIGSFHKISIKHLQRYLDEFTFRFNNRENENLFGLTVARLLAGIVLPYKALTSSQVSE